MATNNGIFAEHSQNSNLAEYALFTFSQKYPWLIPACLSLGLFVCLLVGMSLCLTIHISIDIPLNVAIGADTPMKISDFQIKEDRPCSPPMQFL